MLSRRETTEPGGAAAALPTLNTAHDHQPFTEQELARALQRSHLTVPAH